MKLWMTAERGASYVPDLFVRRLPGELTGAADVLTQILFEGIKDLICLHRTSWMGSSLRVNGAPWAIYERILSAVRPQSSEA
jgi:hypothetical protein